MMSNEEVREYYNTQVQKIPFSLDENCLKKLAIKASELRNEIRTKSRDLMADQTARAVLDKAKPNQTFEQLLERKMNEKCLEYKQALYDIIISALSTNKEVNDRLIKE